MLGRKMKASEFRNLRYNDEYWKHCNKNFYVYCIFDVFVKLQAVIGVLVYLLYHCMEV